MGHRCSGKCMHGCSTQIKPWSNPDESANEFAGRTNMQKHRLVVLLTVRTSHPFPSALYGSPSAF